MSRPISSDILYPFVPTTDPVIIKGIKDIVLVVTGVHSNTVGVPTMTRPFVSLLSINTDIYTFRAYTPNGVGSFYTRDIVFDLSSIPAEGFGSIKSTDGYSTLFLDFSETAPANITPAAEDYVLEPCTTRWLQSAVMDIVAINEQRLSVPLDRGDLDNTVVKEFNNVDKLRLNNGYNVSLSQAGNDLQILGASGTGLGIAPDNMWEDIPPPASVYPVRSINGQSPDADGDFLLQTTAHISIIAEGSTITIRDASLEE